MAIVRKKRMMRRDISLPNETFECIHLIGSYGLDQIFFQTYKGDQKIFCISLVLGRAFSRNYDLLLPLNWPIYSPLEHGQTMKRMIQGLLHF